MLRFLALIKTKLPALLLSSVLLIQPLSITTASSTAQAAEGTNSLSSASWKASDAKTYSAEVPLAWFDLVYELVKMEKISPPVAARVFGYMGVALYEAVWPGMPGYRSLAGQINGLTALPSVEGQDLYWPAAANTALATISAALFDQGSAEAKAAIDWLEEIYTWQYGRVLPPDVFRRSTYFGYTAGSHIAEWARLDGYAGMHNCSYAVPTAPGYWETTPPAHARSLEPCWGELRTFVVSSVDSCPSLPPPVYSEQNGTTFYLQAREVYDTVVHLTPEQLFIAKFWADSPGETGTPPGHSISILGGLIEQQEYKLDIAAEAYARVGMAISDAFVGCWKTKYKYNLMRPVTYIQRFIQPGWMPPVGTPAFPEYPSGHSVQSGAAAQVLTDLFGEIPFTDDTYVEIGFASRSYNTFFEFANEAAISRLYGGIHYRAAIENGLEQGKCIGKKVSAVMFKAQ